MGMATERDPPEADRRILFSRLVSRSADQRSAGSDYGVGNQCPTSRLVQGELWAERDCVSAGAARQRRYLPNLVDECGWRKPDLSLVYQLRPSQSARRELRTSRRYAVPARQP